MNRRTALRSTVALAAVGTAGCLDTFLENFEGRLGRPVPLYLHSEASRPFDVRLRAYNTQTDRQTYDRGLTLRPDERVSPSHLRAAPQQFQVTRVGDDDAEDLVEAGTITPETSSVTVTVFDDDLVLEIAERESANETEDGSANESSETAG